jgi:hypothetical protein
VFEVGRYVKNQWLALRVAQKGQSTSGKNQQKSAFFIKKYAKVIQKAYKKGAKHSKKGEKLALIN